MDHLPVQCFTVEAIAGYFRSKGMEDMLCESEARELLSHLSAQDKHVADTASLHNQLLCTKAFHSLSAAGVGLCVEGFGGNIDWAISELCKAVYNFSAEKRA